MKKSPFPVEFTCDVFDTENELLAKTIKSALEVAIPRVLIVADTNFVQRNDGIGLKIGAYMQRYGLELAAAPIVFNGGERLKTDGFGSVLAVVTAAIRALLGDDGLILAIGGGSLLDAAGMAAGLARGGIKMIRIPTTPAAMIDSVYAERCSINAGGVKDAVRVTSIPSAAIIDTTLASTVLDGVWNGGFGEAVRIAAAADASLLKRLAECAADYSGRNDELLDEIVDKIFAIRQKKSIPPFAEWIAARLEAMSNWKLPHGYAVPFGIAIESAYSVSKGLLKADDRVMIMTALQKSGALDGALQSKALLVQTDNVIHGLKEWRLLEGTEEIPCLSGLGKVSKAPIDEQLYREILLSDVLNF